MKEQEHILFQHDLIIGPIYFLLIIAIAFLIRIKFYKSNPMGRYFMPALLVRLVSAVLSSFMYEFHYKSGDTFLYFETATSFYKRFWVDPQLVIGMLFTNSSNYSDAQNAFKYFITNGHWWGVPSWTVMKITSFINLFTFNSYISTSFIITTFSFIGCWKIYQVLCDRYPHLYKHLAWAVLFVPSVFFWGSGIVKDPLCMGGLGLVTAGVYSLIIKRKIRVFSTFLMIGGAYVVLNVKAYILMAYAPALLFWIVILNYKKIKYRSIRLMLLPVFLGVIVFGGYKGLKLMSSFKSKFDVETVLASAQNSQAYLGRKTERQGGTGYDLGPIELSPKGMLTLIPKAINVTLFRPYLWEVKKPINLIAAIESLIAFLIFMFVLFKVGIFRFFTTLFSNEDVIYCVSFALVFAFFVGFSAANYGSLARYKIPCLPFFYAALVIIYSYRKGGLSNP